MILIRPMTRDDIPEVAKLEKAIFTRPWSEKVYRETFEIAGVGYVVAELNNTIVAAAGVRNIAGTGEITNVMVTPDCRRQAIATRMLGNLLDMGRQLGATEFTLEVRAGNEAAIRLYEKLGFVCEGVRYGFYNDPKEDAKIYWLRG